MCELAVIFWGPAVAVGTALFAGFVIWPVLSIAGIEPRRRVLIGAFLLPVVLVEPFGFAAWVPAPPVLVTALTSGIAQAWIAFTAGVSRPGR